MREIDVLLYGATGFTGKLVAEYLAKRASDEGLRWAIGGRSRAKLEDVRRQLAASNEALADLPIFVADSHDVTALDALAAKTSVVLTTVGPYAKFGFELARACAKHGTSYCDLTGEPNFVRKVIDECHALAKEQQARIVHCTGYDSIPSDLGTQLAADYAKKRWDEDLAWVKIFTGRTKGAVSGGTVASAFGLAKAARADREVRKVLLDPHGLDPVRPPRSRELFEQDQRTVRFDPDLQRWTAPFVMASINARIVRRSHALFKEEDGKGYGADFKYNEAMSFRRGPRGFAAAASVTAGIVGFFAASGFGPTRRLLEKAILPKPGEGPSRETIENGYFEMHVLARTTSGKKLRGRVAGTSDPGYGATATMIGEAAICLAKDSARLAPRFGVLTPATAMGMRLVERLQSAGMTFDIHEA